jgi:hypothetical protein
MMPATEPHVASTLPTPPTYHENTTEKSTQPTVAKIVPGVARRPGDLGHQPIAPTTSCTTTAMMITYTVSPTTPSDP